MQLRLNRLWKKIRRLPSVILSDHQLTAGVIGIIFLLLVILLANVLMTFDPYDYTTESLAAPGEAGHILGTNKLGQDVYSMLIAGVSTSLKVAIISSLISGCVGVLLGGSAGFFGGKVDAVISEVINVFMMIPTFFLILMIVALFGNSITNVMIVIGLTSWASNAKLMRAQALVPLSKVPLSWERPGGRFCSSILFPTEFSLWWPIRPWACPVRS